MASNDSPIVTVTVNTYDRPDMLINRSLKSILSQTFTDFNVIVVGDGPPNSDTREAMASVEDSRITYFELPVNGPYSKNKTIFWYTACVNALNKGLELVTGKYTAHLDDDDEWLPEHLEGTVGLLDSSDYDVVYAKTIAHYPRPRVTKVHGAPPPMVRGMVCHSSLVYKSHLNSIKYRLDITEPADWNRFSRIQASGANVGFLDKFTMVYYGQGMTLEPDEDKLGGFSDD